MTELTRIPGRVVISERALRRTFAAVAADGLGVAADQVRARVTDAAGLLAVSVEGPVTVRTGGASTIELAQAARAQVRERGSLLSGAQIRDVVVRVTTAVVAQPERVR